MSLNAITSQKESIMQIKKNKSSKLLGVLLAGALCATPIILTTAQAAPDRSHQQRDQNDKRRGNRNDNRSDNRNDKQRNRYQTLAGTVTDLERDSFDLRVGSKTYEVHPSGSLPRQLSKNDQVRVYGQVDDDDVRNANVTIIRDNDQGNNGNHWGGGNWGNRYQTLTGVVTDVERDSFDLRVGNKSYEVHPSSRLPSELSRNDQVRVYGQVDDDDVRNANVTIIRDNDRGNSKNDRGNSKNDRWDTKYQTITGTVERISNCNNFDLKENDRTYRVRLSGNAPGGLSKNDVVRVYGQVYGSNDIRNANIKILRNR